MAKAKVDYIRGTGRRKTSVARVRIARGTGKIIINNRPFEDYFPREQERVTRSAARYNILASMSGGGPSGQAGALSLGIARALIKADSKLEEALREHSLLTRDSRMKERKKYGQRGARAKYQFSKR